MKPVYWNETKNRQLRAERGIAFEEVVRAIESGDLLAILDHPNPERYRLSIEGTGNRQRATG